MPNQHGILHGVHAPGFPNPPWPTPQPPGPTVPDHPSATAGMWMALQAIIACFDSTNGLSMAWDDSTVRWGKMNSDLAASMNQALTTDYNTLQAYVDKYDGKKPPDNYSQKVTEMQVKYQTDQTTGQNAMQQPQSELDKEAQQVKDLGTSTQTILTNASAILGISSNTAQQLAH